MNTSIRDLHDALDEFHRTPESYALDVKISLTALVLKKLKEQRWSQRRLADAMGRPESFISRVLHSDENCKISTIGNLLHALGVRAKLVESVQTTVAHSWTFDTPVCPPNLWVNLIPTHAHVLGQLLQRPANLGDVYGKTETISEAGGSQHTAGTPSAIGAA